ncbi:hypothetical protein D5086_011680 [Populus alba]|uniref:Uncharacterized protein n=1 Tax=Populus alba TaxID=43335 RepID=A0ACC4CEI0_POPAL
MIPSSMWSQYPRGNATILETISTSSTRFHELQALKRPSMNQTAPGEAGIFKASPNFVQSPAWKNFTFFANSVICVSINHNRHALETCHPEEDRHSLVILSGPSRPATTLYTHRCSASSSIQHHYYSTEPDQLWDNPAPYVSQEHGFSSFEFRSMDSISCTESPSVFLDSRE